MNGTVRVNFLVIGAGVAGLRAAIETARHGTTLIAGKGEGSTFHAQGGVAVALSEEEEAVAAHLSDTLAAGRGLCREEAVHVLVEEGPARVRELISWGARFDQEGGRFALAREAAHGEPRILRAGGDATGWEILKVLLERAKGDPAIQIRERLFTLDLIVSDGTCRGALLLDEASGKTIAVAADAVILATGGGGQIYLRTTNPPGATGDGMAMAYRAGASLEDMEFVQFHPTALAIEGAPPFLLTEAMRGEGGILKNGRGERFMKRYHPDGELAPRDEVARAILNELAHGAVTLDVSHLESARLPKRFPTIYSTCLKFGIDIRVNPIPVAPAAHYFMGGVKTDIDGRTVVDGLFAAGEVACAGVHGANRLASNSLLEGLVFGARAGAAAALYRGGGRIDRPVDPARAGEIGGGGGGRDQEGSLAAKVESLRQTMCEAAGPIRSAAALTKALTWVEKELLNLSGRQDPLRKMYEAKNLFTVGAEILRAALRREESRGAHFREDFPKSRPEWNGRHITLVGSEHERG